MKSNVEILILKRELNIYFKQQAAVFESGNEPWVSKSTRREPLAVDLLALTTFDIANIMYVQMLCKSKDFTHLLHKIK
jgi:hypothetical protein